MAHRVGTIINFCSIEKRFLKACIEQARQFSHQIVIPVCDHLFDGTPENRELLESVYRAFPDCLFIEYPFLAHKIRCNSHFWHSLSRFLGVQYLNRDIETVLFNDADEIADVKKFSEWLDTEEHKKYHSIKLFNYWYFREPRYQAHDISQSILIADRESCTPAALLSPLERDAIYNEAAAPKRDGVLYFDGTPMFHHYSWVRTKEEMLQKVRAWGHRGDRDWESMIHNEFSRPFQGVDFVHRYKFTEVEPLFNISMGPTTFQPVLTKPPSVIKLTEDDVFSLLLPFFTKSNP